MTVASFMRALELKIPPVGVFLLAGAAMWALARWLPAARFHLPAQPYVVAALLIVSGFTGIAGIIAFRRHQTTIDPMRPHKASSLVIASIYRHTRNPMYLGLALLLVTWAAYLANVAAAVVLPFFVAYMNRFQIRPEERALLESFGDDYARYMSEVRRWL